MRFRDALRADPTLLARYNALKIEAGPRGAAAYADAKARFIAETLARAEPQPRCTRWMLRLARRERRHQLRHHGLGARRVVGAEVAHVDVGRHAAQLGPRVHREVRLDQQHDAGDALRLAVVADERMEQAADRAQAGARDRVQAQRAQGVGVVERRVAAAALQVGDQVESVHRRNGRAVRRHDPRNGTAIASHLPRHGHAAPLKSRQCTTSTPTSTAIRPPPTARSAPPRSRRARRPTASSCGR